MSYCPECGLYLFPEVGMGEQCSCGWVGFKGDSRPFAGDANDEPEKTITRHPKKVEDNYEDLDDDDRPW